MVKTAIKLSAGYGLRFYEEILIPDVSLFKDAINYASHCDPDKYTDDVHRTLCDNEAFTEYSHDDRLIIMSHVDAYMDDFLNDHHELLKRNLYVDQRGDIAPVTSVLLHGDILGVNQNVCKERKRRSFATGVKGKSIYADRRFLVYKWHTDPRTD